MAYLHHYCAVSTSKKVTSAMVEFSTTSPLLIAFAALIHTKVSLYDPHSHLLLSIKSTLGIMGVSLSCRPSLPVLVDYDVVRGAAGLLDPAAGLVITRLCTYPSLQCVQTIAFHSTLIFFTQQ